MGGFQISLKKELQELQARKSVLSGEKAAKVRHLDGMREKVREVELHAAPLQKEYAANGIAEQYKKYETNAARLLPKPLYSLLYILVGWITATDEKLIHVSIIGSEAEAAKGALSLDLILSSHSLILPFPSRIDYKNQGRAPQRCTQTSSSLVACRLLTAYRSQRCVIKGQLPCHRQIPLSCCFRLCDCSV